MHRAVAAIKIGVAGAGEIGGLAAQVAAPAERVRGSPAQADRVRAGQQGQGHRRVQDAAEGQPGPDRQPHARHGG
jgi:hypothetical protein